MNIQAMMKQAQKLQKEMLNTKDEIDRTTYEGKSSFVTVKMNGAKKLLDIKIEKEMIEEDEIEILQDMIIVAINDVMKKIDKEIEEKLGKYTQGMPGLF